MNPSLNFHRCLFVSCAMALGLAACSSKTEKPKTLDALPPQTATIPESATPPPANAQMQKILDAYKSENPKPLPDLSAKDARTQPSAADALKKVMKEEKKSPDTSGFANVTNRKITVGQSSIPATIYSPAKKSKSAHPIIVYYHGGGFVIATNKTYDASARVLGKRTGAIVVSVEYRKAPEYKFPTAHNDAFEAYKWVLSHAKELGGDPTKVAVAGESAGGNLALNTAIAARDAGIQKPVYELLIYPVAGSDMTTASYQENANAKFLDKPMMEWFMKNYLTSADEAKDPRINLVSANVQGLAPVTVITAQIDPLRSEGKELADHLRDQGVQVSYRNFDGVTHEFFGMGQVLDEAKQAEEFATSDLKKALTK